MTVAFYQHNEDQAGFHYDGSTWTQFGPPLVGADLEGGGFWVSATAALPTTSSALVYATAYSSNVLSISSDGGLTWLQRPISELGALGREIFSLWARVPGELYFMISRPGGTQSGIWRTVDEGVTWTRIVPCTNPYRPGWMAIGVNKLFYAERTAQSHATHPWTDTWVFRRCNLDGSTIETWATRVFTEVSNGMGGWTQLPDNFLLRAISDDWVLVANYDAGEGITGVAHGVLWKIDASGITDVRPSGLGAPWDLLPLTTTDWLAVGQIPFPGAGSPSYPNRNDVLVYRTQTAGTTWTHATTIPAAEAFAERGAVNTYFMVSAPRPWVPNEVVMLGNAGSEIQQIIWYSTDSGATWTSMLNAADPIDSLGDWLVLGPGGLASVCYAAPPAPALGISSQLVAILG